MATLNREKWITMATLAREKAGIGYYEEAINQF
jgi:hypothetical protein